MREALIVLGLAAFVVVGSACASSDTVNGTLGEEGRVDFSYLRSCFFGCPLEQPLLSGTVEVIGFSEAGDAAGITVSSSDPAVAAFALERACYCDLAASTGTVAIAEDGSCDSFPGAVKHCDNTVNVAAGDPGEAWVELRDSGGALVDRARVTVALADRALFLTTLPGAVGPADLDPVDLAAGESATVELTLYTVDGLALLAPEGVAWSTGDGAVAVVNAWLFGIGPAVSAGLEVNVDALAPGDTPLAIDVPGLQADLSLHVF